MKKLILFLAALTFTLNSCKKEFKEGEVPAENKKMADLTIDDQFNWKTTKDITVSLSSSSDNTVSIKSQNGDVYLKAFLKGGYNFDTKITVPTFEKEVHVICNNQSHLVSVANNNLDYHFN